MEFIRPEAMLAAGDLPHVDEYADSEWDAPPRAPATHRRANSVRLLAASRCSTTGRTPPAAACAGRIQRRKVENRSRSGQIFPRNTRGYAPALKHRSGRCGDYEDLFLRQSEIILAYQQDLFAVVRAECNCLPSRRRTIAFGVLNNFPTNTAASTRSSDRRPRQRGFDPPARSCKAAQLHETNGTDPEKRLIPESLAAATRVSTKRSGTTANVAGAGHDGRQYAQIEFGVGGTHDATSKGLYCTGFFNRKFLDMGEPHRVRHDAEGKSQLHHLPLRHAEILSIMLKR